MADITMCSNIDCPLRTHCYRFTATPNDMWQSMQEFDWKRVDGAATCNDYWPDSRFPTGVVTA